MVTADELSPVIWKVLSDNLRIETKVNRGLCGKTIETSLVWVDAVTEERTVISNDVIDVTNI